MKRLLLVVPLVVACATLDASRGFRSIAPSTDAGARALLAIGDLIWQGMFGFPAGGLATPDGPGTMAYASGALAVRYVGGQRRLLVPTFTNASPSTGQNWGDLVEWQEPDADPWAASTPLYAPELIETRRWSNWTMIRTTPSWQDKASGVQIGGLYWDEARGVLWYTLYAYYSGTNHPILAATQLLDRDIGGGYRTVGAKYGPWWYRDNNPSDTNHLYWKAVDYWLTPIPAASQSDLGDRKMILGGAVGAIGGAGHIGPGFHAISDLPRLTDPPNSIIPLELRLADYSPESPLGRRECERDANYVFDGNPYSANATGLRPAVNGVGRWQMSLDQVNSFVWVETATKEGILLFGRQAIGTTWYGFNSRSRTPGYLGPPDAVDPTRENPDLGNGYGTSAWKAALYVFDPAHVREVGRGERSPYADGMKPAAVYDWHAQWPNLPFNTYRNGPTAIASRPIESNISNTAFWDAKAEQVIWIQPHSIAGESPRPTINLFSVKR